MSANHYDRKEIKRRLPMPSLFVKLGLFEKEPKDGVYPCPLHKETRGASLSLTCKADGWVANCFSPKCGFKGDEFGVIQRHYCLPSIREAFAIGAELAGLTGTATPYNAPMQQTPRAPVQSPNRFENLPAIPEAVAKVWLEGVEYLRNHADARENDISEPRCWPMHWVEALVERGDIGMPVCYGKRAVGFPVYCPAPEFRLIGFHARSKPRNEGERPGWRYFPNANTGQTTPSLPFIMSGWEFIKARLLVILGGQWDAITFAGAAGWLGAGRQWPDGVCVLAPRGDSGTKTFLEAYAPIWPKDCKVLLFPDGDASGRTWIEGKNCFAEQLRKRGCRVAVVHTAPYKDTNDLYRAQEVTPERVAALLAEHGMEVTK